MEIILAKELNGFVDKSCEEMFMFLDNLNDISMLIEENIHKTARIVHGTESTLHYGYMNPSPTREMVVGCTKRGRLLKRPRNEHSPFEYFLDEHNKLVMIMRNHHKREGFHEQELFFYHENIVTSLNFECKRPNPRNTVNTSQMKYNENGLISEYVNMQIDSVYFPRVYSDKLPLQEKMKLVNHVDIERYHYQNGRLLVCEMIDFSTHLRNSFADYLPYHDVVSLRYNGVEEIESYDLFHTLYNRKNTFQQRKPFRINKAFYEYWNQLMIGDPKID
ncbi:MAG: hypothetical protein A2Y20_02440 [Firmicutes bacterium GWF2_51_9]|nr:MAG: hypothetical protein A2Y20_02440 [Firmicutes bacterium GWF2_51_9]OGS59572.1 MAG: hypothetical protein A2Y19_08055 [Firmicutes bacterium GWE2_51_13]HAM63363.1 hypothetical protein [Erysipelotrichaceae bacterium]HAO61383.1 hypothetical protein [Erysipelotrichaceae bacterium]HBZ41435.1 hypothetical protein [Erysipelotrichaceae bacterium]